MTDRGQYMDAIATLERLFLDRREISEAEWREVGTLLVKLGETAIERSATTNPQPLMSSAGYARCTTNCTLFSSYMDQETRSSRCLSGDGQPTREGVPCSPWVEHFVKATAK